MLNWAFSFLVLALLAAVFGFCGIAADSANIAKMLFVVFLVLSLIGFVAGRVRKVEQLPLLVFSREPQQPFR
jgi:uncharacterized membrane protein YtjA (UPF0391 family)